MASDEKEEVAFIVGKIKKIVEEEFQDVQGFCNFLQNKRTVKSS